MSPCWRFVALILTLASLALAQPSPGSGAAIQESVTALQHNDYKSAEQKLRSQLKLHPNDAEVLSLLGVALDGQQKFSEATVFHRQALANAPASPAVLNNYATNLLATGDEKGARELLLRSVGLDPSNYNANLELAQLALQAKDGAEALVYLDTVKDAPGTAILRLLALDMAGDYLRASTEFERLASTTRNDGKLSAEDGMTLARAGQFEQAETFLANALAAEPANFQILYDLGVTATQAGHTERARATLEAALRQQPENVDVLYALAFAFSNLKSPESAVRLLAKAARLAPQRPDVQELLAFSAGAMKAYEDSIAAWDRYLKLVPDDDVGHREVAFEKAHLGLFDQALPDLELFVARHPNDASGWYELGVTQSADDTEKAIQSLNKAIALEPDLVIARSARGSLLYAQNKPEAALADLEFVVKQPSANPIERAAALDRLGQAYLALDRLPDGVSALREALALTPGDSTTQLHLANALAEAGQTQESDALMEHFRQMRPDGKAPAIRGVLDYLNLTPEQRHEDYQARLEKTVRDHPDDKITQLLYLKFLLTNNRMAEAAADARRFAALKPGSSALRDAGHALLSAKQYNVAKELLEQAAAVSATDTGLRLDLAIASFHAALSGNRSSPDSAANEGLHQLDLIPESARDADYYVARSEMLDTARKPDNAIAAMNQALQASPGRADFYWQAAALMVKNHHNSDALQLLEKASTLMPGEVQIPVTRAVVLELSGKADDAQRLLNDTQHRWPEVAAVWVAQGIIFAAHQHPDAARKALETASILGAHSTEMWYELADVTFRAGPDHFGAAEAAIRQGLAGAPDDLPARALAAQIADAAHPGQLWPGDAAKGRSENSDPASLVLTRLLLAKPPHDW